MGDLVYLDHGATTPLEPDVLAAMLPWLGASYANPSALYQSARAARASIEDSRAEVADILGCRPSEVIFTSGGTESVNLALRGIGLAQLRAHSGSRIITSTIEHQAVLHTCQYLDKFGFEISYAGVDADAMIATDEVIRSVGPDTALISLMLANNEVGTIQPIREIARAARLRGAQWGKRIVVHTDAVAAAGQIPLAVDQLEVDSLSLAAHKFGGPKGGGILYLRRGIPFLAQQTGGGQEHQRRAGTENVAAIVGTARALRIAAAALPDRVRKLKVLRDRLIVRVLRATPGAALNGHPTERLAGNVSFRLPGINGEELLFALDREGIAASSGSACADASWEPSHVVLAMGYNLADAAASVRFTLGPATTEAEIDRAAATLAQIVERFRSGEPTVSVGS
jgi:cysteine desulfurase